MEMDFAAKENLSSVWKQNLQPEFENVFEFIISQVVT